MTENPPNPDDFPTPPPYPGQQPYQGQQPYGGQPQQYPGAPSPQYSGQGMQKHPRATTALVLGILGLVVCGALGPFAWVIGGKAVKEIDANPGVWAGRSEANTGRILGIIATVLLILGVVVFVVFVGFGILAALNDPEFMSELEAEWDAASVLSGFFG